MSETFGVANGVEGGVLSPVLFTVYLDELLQRLTSLDIGCHVGHHYVEPLHTPGTQTSYAMRTILPSLLPPPLLSTLLREYKLYAIEHDLQFNVAKTVNILSLFA